VARSVDEKDRDFYAGPFLPAKLGRRTMVLSHRLFGLRSCNEIINGRRGRPCLEYDIKRCIAPCVAELCTEERYGEAVANTRLLLEGRTEELAGTLRERMQSAAESERFEEAAQLRDALRTVQTLAERQQKLATPQSSDRDVFGLKVGPSGGVIQVFAMRGGRVVERVELAIEAGAVAGGDADVMGAVLGQFYERRVPPPEIDLPVGIEDDEAMGQWLSARGGRKVRLLVPQRGDRRALVELATRNAELSYRTRHNENTAAHFEALETLRAVLGLTALPRRIECFDISTIQGSETVASMVVCEDGRMKKADYRKFRIRQLPEKGPDDFAAMREVVQRRYKALLEAGGPFPDLILIDGGMGQVSAAYEALESVGLGNLEAVGIAKREELLIQRDRPEPIALAENDPALLLLQRVRDEAHRFAVTFHRKARSMRDLRSELDDVPGVGPRRRRALLRSFGSLSAVRRATREELTGIVGPKVASAVIDHFARTRT
jgi:excinuclease ABC subunit C